MLSKQFIPHRMDLILKGEWANRSGTLTNPYSINANLYKSVLNQWEGDKKYI